jgi:excisionase family DNA binding protein
VARAEDQFLSTEEVAERLQVDEQTVRRWIKSGKLEAFKPGREWRISPAAFETLLESYSSPKAEAPKSPGPLDEKAFGEFILGLIEKKSAGAPPLEEQSDQTRAAVDQAGERVASGRGIGTADAHFVEEDSPERKQVVAEALRVLEEEYQRSRESTSGRK